MFVSVLKLHNITCAKSLPFLGYDWFAKAFLWLAILLAIYFFFGSYIRQFFGCARLSLGFASSSSSSRPGGNGGGGDAPLMDRHGVFGGLGNHLFGAEGAGAVAADSAAARQNVHLQVPVGRVAARPDEVHRAAREEGADGALIF